MPDCRMYVRTSGDKARGAEKTRDDKGEKGRCFARPLRRTLARCWIAGLVQEAVQPSFATVAAVGHPWFFLPRGTAVFHRSLWISSHTWLRLPAYLGDCLVRLDSLAALAFSLSFFAALLCPLPLRPLPCNPHPGYLSWPIVHLSLSLSLFLSVPLRLRFAVVSPYFRANGDRHERLNIFPLSLFFSSFSSSLSFYRHPTYVLVILFSFPTLAAHYAGLCIGKPIAFWPCWRKDFFSYWH